MKYKKYIYSLLLIIGLILLNIIFKDNIFLLTISLPVFLIITFSLVSFDVSEMLFEYKKKKDNIGIVNTVKYGILNILLFCLLFSIFLIPSAIVLEKMFLIKGLSIVYIFMSISTMVIPLLNIIKTLLIINGYDKFSKRLYGSFILVNLVLFLLEVICFLLFKINVIWLISLLYFNLILSLIIIVIFIKLLLKIKLNEFNIFTKKRINYFKEIKKTTNKNFKKNIFKIINVSYIYISIIFVYISCLFRYGFDSSKIINVINNTYFYSLFLLFSIVLVIGIINKKVDILITYILNKIMPYIIILIIISGLICKLIFNSYNNAMALIIVLILSFFVTIYINVDNLLKKNFDKKRFKIMILGIITKMLIGLPLIDAFYRLGYSVIYGDLLATVISLVLSSLLGISYLLKKENIKVGKFLEKVIMYFYKNIILCLILILLQYIIPIDVNNRLLAGVFIIIYIILGIVIYNFKSIILKLLELK